MELAEIIAILVAGFFLGVQHAFDSDHLVAVSTMVTQSKSLKRSALLGILWGSGHTITLLLIGLIVMVFRLSIPKWLESLFEQAVGVFLIILGLSVIWRIRKKRIHIHSHSHDSKEHLHLHSHAENRDHYHQHRAYFAGTFNGLAGSAALMLLVISTISSIGIGITYIVFFGLGSILGMLVFVSLFHLPLAITNRKLPILNKAITSMIGVFSIAFGIYYIIMQ